MTEHNWANISSEWFGQQDPEIDPELSIRNQTLVELGFGECTTQHLGVGIKTRYLQERIIRDVKINPQLGRIDTMSSIRIIRNMTNQLDKNFPGRYRFEMLMRNKKLDPVPLSV